MPFKEVNPRQNFPEMERGWVAHWKKHKTFEKSVESRPKDKEFVFYDGPPFATGLPHYGHILAGTMKDVVPRYQTMRGHRVERVFGWDCHGLPIENLIEKDLDLKTKKDIEEKFGIAKFNEACRASVLKYTNEWEDIVSRMGRWIDFKNDYKTMDPEYMESIWWVFKELWNKDMIYQGLKPMHVCPRCVTPLSNFEVTLGYIDVKDTAVFWKFKVLDEKYPDTYLIAWTTTPWSTPSTMGLSVGPKFDYVRVRVISPITGKEEFLIFVKDSLEKIMEGYEGEYEVVEEMKGSDIIGLKYEPILDCFKELPEVAENEKVYTTFGGDYVENTEGTGIVTINGAYGEIDMEAAKANGLPIVLDVDMTGEFNEKAGDYAGMYVKDGEVKLIEDMTKKNLVWKTEKYKHSYPHCWRCDSPLLNYATSAWFVSIDKIKQQMLKENAKINWVPNHVGHGRFNDWLENARDWCISRTRYWGAPLPVWIGEESGEAICIGSIQELEELSGQKVTDLHKHFVDDITFENKGETFRRIPEVLDCWFESGSMPYAQQHYPFENKEKFEGNFPAEFIAEGLDQTRGWFYTLMVLGCGLFGKSPYKNVIVNGMILAEDGKKMSKRLKNYPDPSYIFEEYGADALRFYLMNSPVVRAEPLRFSEKGVADVVRRILLPLWNSYSFFVTYANIDNWQPAKDALTQAPETTNKLDQWIISELEELLKELTEELDNYDLQKASTPIIHFIESLTNWYIRRSRRRFWKSESDTDKDQAYATLYYCLVRISQVIAPFMPFISEEIYTNLTDEESVHLSYWPEFDAKKIDLELNQEVKLTRQIVTLGHAIRAQKRIKVRQPLAEIQVAIPEGLNPENLEKDTILEELNVKQFVILENPTDIAEIIVKPDGKILGPKYGKDVQYIIQEAKAGNFKKLADEKIEVLDYVLEPLEYEVHYVGKTGLDVASEAGIVVGLDTELTDELTTEGIARDTVRFIQDMRKEVDYKVSDRIDTYILTNTEITRSLKSFGDYIRSETLTNSLIISTVDEIEAKDAWDLWKEYEIDGQNILVGVKKA
jgi:isoleucyl-tRNA synthetase